MVSHALHPNPAWPYSGLQFCGFSTNYAYTVTKFGVVTHMGKGRFTRSATPLHLHKSVARFVSYSGVSCSNCSCELLFDKRSPLLSPLAPSFFTSSNFHSSFTPFICVWTNDETHLIQPHLSLVINICREYSIVARPVWIEKVPITDGTRTLVYLTHPIQTMWQLEIVRRRLRGQTTSDIQALETGSLTENVTRPSRADGISLRLLQQQQACLPQHINLSTIRAEHVTFSAWCGPLTSHSNLRLLVERRRRKYFDWNK